MVLNISQEYGWMRRGEGSVKDVRSLAWMNAAKVREVAVVVFRRSKMGPGGLGVTRAFL